MTARRDERSQIALGLFIPYGLCALRVLLTASQLVESDCDSHPSPKSNSQKSSALRGCYIYGAQGRDRKTELLWGFWASASIHRTTDSTSKTLIPPPENS